MYEVGVFIQKWGKGIGNYSEFIRVGYRVFIGNGRPGNPKKKSVSIIITNCYTWPDTKDHQK